jgi:serine/threonine-protein kinase
MSPEQASAYDDVDGRADIYALGAVAYFLLTGKPPFSGMDVVELLRAHSDGEVVPPSKLNADVPGDLERVVLRCLAKKATDRFPDAASLGQALAACQCASDWTNEAAATWWRENQGLQGQMASTKDQPYEATIDLKPDCE